MLLPSWTLWDFYHSLEFLAPSPAQPAGSDSLSETRDQRSSLRLHVTSKPNGP
jgi:hypothetical protein